MLLLRALMLVLCSIPSSDVSTIHLARTQQAMADALAVVACVEADELGGRCAARCCCRESSDRCRILFNVLIAAA